MTEADRPLLESMGRDIREIRTSMNMFHENASRQLGESAIQMASLKTAIDKMPDCSKCATTAKVDQLASTIKTAKDRTVGALWMGRVIWLAAVAVVGFLSYVGAHWSMANAAAPAIQEVHQEHPAAAKAKP